MDAPRRSLRLLVVDDDPITLRFMVQLLKLNKHQVLEAQDGVQALEIVQREQIDMVLLDVMMPGMDGFVVLETLRQSSDVPVLMVTAKNDNAAIERGFMLGADDYISKPFKPQQLFDRLDRLVRHIPPPAAQATAAPPGQIRLDKRINRFFVGAVGLDLTPVESRLLQTLMGRLGQAVPLRELARAAWGTAGVSQADVLVGRAMRDLQQKFAQNPQTDGRLQSVAGVSYRLE